MVRDRSSSPAGPLLTVTSAQDSSSVGMPEKETITTAGFRARNSAAAASGGGPAVRSLNPLVAHVYGIDRRLNVFRFFDHDPRGVVFHECLRLNELVTRCAEEPGFVDADAIVVSDGDR